MMSAGTIGSPLATEETKTRTKEAKNLLETLIFFYFIFPQCQSLLWMYIYIRYKIYVEKGEQVKEKW